MRHIEFHRSARVGWLRAAVLGANDGILSTASLILGVAAAGATQNGILVAGSAGLVAGALSMAAGEFVSVSSQSDTEDADLARERLELANDVEREQAELAAIYIARGLDALLARQVASQLMAHDALGAHARDELGISELHRARPLEAAFTSAAAFAGGAALPLLVVLLVPAGLSALAVVSTSPLLLGALGGLAANAGGAKAVTGALRVCAWGAFAMGCTYGIGAIFGTAV